jgi:hypothetical protein
MKKHIWSNPATEWGGFGFTAYGLDMDKVGALSVTQQRLANGKHEETSTTLGDVFRKLANQQFEIEPSSMGIGLKMGTEQLGFHKPIFAASLLAELIRFGKEEISPFDTLWFWYDNDTCRDDPHELYSFFVVYDDRIVRESLSFSDYHGSGFDPDIFQPSKGSDSVWFNDHAWQGANTRYWYRKFYTETRTGQLMLLRDDNPKIYDYQTRPGTDMTALFQNVPILLNKIRMLLWVLIFLGAVVVLLLWK